MYDLGDYFEKWHFFARMYWIIVEGELYSENGKIYSYVSLKGFLTEKPYHFISSYDSLIMY